ncbi:hypothetical protein HMPREF9248_0215 [Fannyhessea vaginae PB189-T1-4]|uniref:Uncharacterized protein n=1 Tax=Fannyhessea vaginae PB189-T1-4 TaxID=866774 RepID=A0ABN0AZH0_9ACTN|nr:hypothetical protein HMPREF9248_0215 [Fannyhessea vaginae PB189-T1-4]
MRQPMNFVQEKPLTFRVLSFTDKKLPYSAKNSAFTNL